MKPITTQLAGIAGYVFLAPVHLWRLAKRKMFLTTLVLAVVLSSCFQHYFRTGTISKADAATIQKLQSAEKYFVFHSSNDVNGLANMTVSGDRIEADLVPLSAVHSKYLDPNARKSNRVKKTDKPLALMEVHLYVAQALTSGQTHISIPLSSLNRIDVYEFDKAATTSNHILSGVGVGLVSAVVIFGIIVMISCNCPQVYVNNSGQYEFKSGVYSGAVYSSLERTDYLPLDGLQPVDNTYQLRINNVPDEEQFINQTLLLRAEHPADIKVLADRNGRILSYKNLQFPLTANYNKAEDISSLLRYRDAKYYSFESAPGSTGLSYINLSFDKPAGATRGKLLVHAGNSKWSGYLNNEFVSLFGNGYEKWRSQQETAKSANARQWQTDQGLPLKVFVETKNGWEYVDHFALTGNTASRDMIMEVDISKVKTDKLKIRIETVFQFWNLDMAAMDFSPENSIRIEMVQPVTVLTESGKPVKDGLLQQDKDYVQLEGNEYLQVEFPAQAAETGMTQSLFLVAAGYYHNLKKIDGNPDIQALLKFKEAGGFDRFSRTRYAGVQDALAKTLIKN